MSNGIRIDELPSTVVPTTTHVIPAMKDGLTVKLQVGQIAQLVAGVGGVLPSTGGTLTGPLTITYNNPALTFNKTSGNESGVYWKTGLTNRWKLVSDATGETGSNAGSNLKLSAHLDAGTEVPVLNVERKSGQLNFLTSPAVRCVNPGVALDKTATSGQAAALYGAVGGKIRWSLLLGDATAEAAGNVGSDFAITRYDNNGASLGNALRIDREHGDAFFGSSVTFSPDPHFWAGPSGNSNIIAFGEGYFLGFDKTSRQMSWTMPGGAAFSVADDHITTFHAPVRMALGSTGATEFGHALYFGVPSYPAVYLQGSHTVGSVAHLRIVVGTQTTLFDTGGGIQITGSGAIKATGTTWANPSDERIKTDIQDYPQGLEAICGLRPVTFRFISETKQADDLHVGLVAQEAEVAMPGIVSTAPGGMGDLQFEDFKSLDASNVIWALVNSIRELNARLEALEGAASPLSQSKRK